MNYILSFTKKIMSQRNRLKRKINRLIRQKQSLLKVVKKVESRNDLLNIYNEQINKYKQILQKV